MEGIFWSNAPTPLPNMILSINEREKCGEINGKKENLGHEMPDIIVSKTRGESLQQGQNDPTTTFQFLLLEDSIKRVEVSLSTLEWINLSP